MIYTNELENMCPVAKGVDHGPAPIPEEGKWIKAKDIKDPVKKKIYQLTGNKSVKEADLDKLAKKLGVKENKPLYNRLNELGVFE